MRRKILIGCYSIPGCGGANTSGYKLFEMMQNDGHEAHYVNIISEEDSDYFKYVFGAWFGNPKNIFGNPYVITMNWASRLELLEQIGLFDEDLRRGEDNDLSYRILQVGRTFAYAANVLPTCALHRIRFPGRMTSQDILLPSQRDYI